MCHVDRGRVCRMMVRIARTGCQTSFGGTGDAFGDPSRSLRRELKEQSLGKLIVGEIKPNRLTVVQRTHQLFTDLFELIVSYSWH